MRKLSIIIVLAAVCFLTAGCWSKYELTERGFVMGVALDLGEDEKIHMLTQIYRPVSSEIGTPTMTTESSVNIKTADDTIMETIRDIPIHLGRKAQWSHMRVIIVGEKLAKNTDISKILDLFYRDHEPRSSVKLMISKGPAYKMFEKKPLIEQTTAQQFLKTEESSFNNAAKTLDTTLLTMIRQLRSPHPDAVVSYVYEDKASKDIFSAAGLAVLKRGKMKAIIPASKVEGLIILRNEYSSGVVEIPCPGMKGEKETTEVLSMDTKTKVDMKGGDINVHVRLKGEVAIGELKCTKILDRDSEKAFLAKVEAAIKKQVHQTVTLLQKSKLDVIGIGNQIYRKSPKTWDKLKKNWDERFADIPFDYQIEVKLITSGTISSKPAS